MNAPGSYQRCAQRSSRRPPPGVSLSDAAKATDVRLNTVKDWLKKGRRDPQGAYGEFARAIDEARQDAQENQGAMSREEFDVHLAKAIRRGSVTAMNSRRTSTSRPSRPHRSLTSSMSCANEGDRAG